MIVSNKSRTRVRHVSIYSRCAKLVGPLRASANLFVPWALATNSTAQSYKYYTFRRGTKRSQIPRLTRLTMNCSIRLVSNLGTLFACWMCLTNGSLMIVIYESKLSNHYTHLDTSLHLWLRNHAGPWFFKTPFSFVVFIWVATLNHWLLPRLHSISPLGLPLVILWQD